MDWAEAARRAQADAERALTVKERGKAFRCRGCRKWIVAEGLCWTCSIAAKRQRL